jgi:hypothetical protein
MSRSVFLALAVLPPCLPLFTGPPHATDWVNNVWQIEYGADHLSRTGLPPTAMNTAELGGIPYPIFYGFLIYPLLSAVAVVAGAENALRLLVAGVNVLQFVLVRRAVRDGGGGEFLASAVACLTVWAIYPFTNVYNRGAVMEFLASGLLTCALCRWFALLDAETPRTRLRAALEVGLLYTLAAGAHPITALYGFAFLALHAVTGFARSRHAGQNAVAGRFLALIPAGVLTVVVLSPWVYACSQLSDKFTIRGYGLHLFPDTIDCWWQRLLSLPRDAWTILGVLDPSPSSPPLDAQMNGPLVIVGAVAAWAAGRGARGRRAWWLAVPILLGLTALGMSFRAEPYELLPSPFRMVQFTYRLVTYVNLAALALVLLAVRLPRECAESLESPSLRAVGPFVLVTSLAVAGFALGVKLLPAVQRTAPVAVEAGHLPDSFNGWDDYTTPNLYSRIGIKPEDEPRWTDRVRMELPVTGKPRYAPLRLNRPEARVVIVQVQPFPWTVLEVDGAPVREDWVFVWFGPPGTQPDPKWARRPYLCVLILPGEHVLVHRFKPPTAWRALTALSFLAFFCWCGVVAVGGFRRWRWS